MDTRLVWLPTYALWEVDLRRARVGHGCPAQEGTQMLIVGIVCDLGVRRVRHKGTLEPLDELALQTMDVSNISLNHM